MFEDDKPNNPPSNLPAEPVDILAGVEDGAVENNMAELGTTKSDKNNALEAGLLKPAEEQASHKSSNPMEADLAAKAGSLNQVAQYKMREPILGKVLFIVLLVVVIGVVLVAGWYVYSKFFGTSKNEITTTPVTTTNTSTVETKPVVTVVTTSDNSEIINQQTNDSILFGELVDTDEDGLDDIREKQLGTDPNIKDTDQDGLSDGDEVLIWKTKPLVKDTDGDTYLDGEEIQHGYSPLGPGKLYNLPKTVSNTNNATSSN